MISSTITPVQSALMAAKAVLADKGRSFYWASKFLGNKQAKRATRLYRFCRHIDDLADEAQSLEMALQVLEEVRADILSGCSKDLLVGDMLALMQECNIDPVIVVELIQGVISDLDTVRIEDKDALLRYCYRVAGTVGIMMCAVLDVTDEKAFSHAIDLGIAMQLTNICRDIGDDAKLNRCYIPSGLVDKISTAELIDPAIEIQEHIKEASKNLLDLADHYYKSGEHGLAYIPFRARCGILIAARIYHAIGTKQRNENYNYWRKRIFVNKYMKLFITFSSLSITLFQAYFWWPRFVHQPSLHKGLEGLPNIKIQEGLPNIKIQPDTKYAY
jgi:phytoene synthase